MCVYTYIYIYILNILEFFLGYYMCLTDCVIEIFRIRQIIVCVHFHMSDRVRVGYIRTEESLLYIQISVNGIYFGPVLLYCVLVFR